MDGEFQSRYAENIIQHQYGDRVDIVGSAESSIKFGKNLNINAGVEETVWNTGGEETYPTTNAIDTVSSSDAGDSVVMRVTGHTVDANGDFTRVEQEVTLDGQNKVLLGTPLARVERMFNTSGTDLAGSVYTYEDDTIVGGIPQTQANIHLTVNAADNQSLKCAMSTDKDEYLVISALTVSVNKQQAANVDFRIQIRRKGKVFRTTYTCSVSSNNGSRQLMFPQPFIIPPSSDVRLQAEASANNVGVEGIMHCFYAKKTFRNV